MNKRRERTKAWNERVERAAVAQYVKRSIESSMNGIEERKFEQLVRRGVVVEGQGVE